MQALGSPLRLLQRAVRGEISDLNRPGFAGGPNS